MSGSETTTASHRVVGVDVARGVALLGMMATHVFDTFNRNGTPSAATVIASGRSAATFVLIAGVSLAFLSGGRAVAHGPRLAAARAGIAVRAGIIGAIGLVLGFVELDDISVILPYYGLMFLLAIPLLGLSPRMLALITVTFIALGPVLLIVTERSDLPLHTGGDLTLATLVEDPVGLIGQLFVTGSFAAVVYIAYLCAGLAIGRLDLTSPRLAWSLLGGGLALAVTARVVADVLLYRLGGLTELLGSSRASSNPARATARLLWDPEQGQSWWYLALPSPHANTPVDLVHTLGSAMAVLGAALLLTQTKRGRRVLGPVAAAGAMTLTLYSAHLLVLATGVLERHPTTLYLVLVAASVLVAVLWRRQIGQGPLERLVMTPANWARSAVVGPIESDLNRKSLAITGERPTRTARDDLRRSGSG